MAFSSFNTLTSVNNKSLGKIYTVTPPSNLILTSIRSTIMRLSFTPSTTNGTNLTYYISTSPATTVTTTTSTFVYIYGLTESTTYTFSIYGKITEKNKTSTTSSVVGTTQSSSSDPPSATVNATGTYIVNTSYVDPVDSKTYTQYVFTAGSSNSFAITNNQSTTYNILAIAGGGGGGGGSYGGGGAGAGGFVQSSITLFTNTETISINVGSGGTANTKGNNTVVSFTTNTSYNITCIGGGKGGPYGGAGGAGGSGGGCSRDSGITSPAASGTAGQGNNGGTTTAGSWSPGAGGGGAGAVGGNGVGTGSQGSGTTGSGGIGKQFTLRGYSNTLYWCCKC